MMTTEYNFPTVVRHVYDIDAFEILDKLKEKYSANIEHVPQHLLELINSEEESLIDFLNEEGIDALEHQKHRNFIMPSNYNLYHYYLGYKLLTIDLYKIEPLLSWQSVLFMGNYYAPKDNFLGLVEFSVYDFVKTSLLPFEQIRLEKIVNWLERNRVFLVNKAYNESSNEGPVSDEADNAILQVKEEDQVLGLKGSAKKQKPKGRAVIMDPQFANVFYEKFKCFFEGQDRLLYNFIIKNEFTEQLVFNGQDNQLAELFKRLRYNSIIKGVSYKLLAQWITDCFATKNDNGELQPLVFITIHAVFKSSDREPPKTKRILVELAQYLLPDDRKMKRKNE